MKWTVVWKPLAERNLAQLWVDGPERQAISEAANRIDLLLKHIPGTVGESRGPNRRILLDPPLGVVYRVSEPDRMVIVLAVWRFAVAK